MTKRPINRCHHSLVYSRIVRWNLKGKDLCHPVPQRGRLWKVWSPCCPRLPQVPLSVWSQQEPQPTNLCIIGDVCFCLEKTGPRTRTSPGLVTMSEQYSGSELGDKRQRSYEARGPGFIRDKRRQKERRKNCGHKTVE